MAKITVPAIVEGGKATAGPPIGPTLAPLGVNIAQVVAEINKKTASFAGTKVPVKIIVDKATKTYEIEVGSPATGELIKKELGIEKGRKGGAEDPKTVGDISLEIAMKIAKMKRGGSLSKSLKDGVKEVLGSCVSLGITCNKKDARETIKEIEEGKHDSTLAS